MGDNKVDVQESQILIDTGSSYTVMPQTDFARMVWLMRRDSGIQFDILDQDKVFTCSDEQVAKL
jgi:predicted aspartyl protease